MTTNLRIYQIRFILSIRCHITISPVLSPTCRHTGQTDQTDARCAGRDYNCIQFKSATVAQDSILALPTAAKLEIWATIAVISSLSQ
jgi:hypothetical protein